MVDHLQLPSDFQDQCHVEHIAIVQLRGDQVISDPEQSLSYDFKVFWTHSYCLRNM